MTKDDIKESEREACAEWAIIYYPQVKAVLPALSKRSGYALAVHGSEKRDLDIVAVPWTEECISPEELADLIVQRVGLFVDFCHRKKDFDIKPHGRIAYFILLPNGCSIDLSIMPKEQQ